MKDDSIHARQVDNKSLNRRLATLNIVTKHPPADLTCGKIPMEAKKKQVHANEDLSKEVSKK
jgi:hypothetical protein